MSYTDMSFHYGSSIDYVEQKRPRPYGPMTLQQLNFGESEFSGFG